MYNRGVFFLRRDRILALADLHVDKLQEEGCGIDTDFDMDTYADATLQSMPAP